MLSSSIASLFTNASSITSGLPISSSSTCDITCLVFAEAISIIWAEVATSTPIAFKPVGEIASVTSGTPITSAPPSYSNVAATSLDPMYIPSIYENGTITGSGIEFILPTNYLGVQGVQIITDCSVPGCTATEDCNPNSVFLNVQPTGFPYKGITTAGYYWINAGIDFSDGLGQGLVQTFLSLLDLPSNCPVEFNGPPWSLTPVAQLSEIQAITSSNQSPEASTTASPGLAITSTPTPSTFRGPYHLSTDTVMSNTMVQLLSPSSLPTRTAPDLPVISLGSVEITANSATQYAIGSKSLVVDHPAITVSGTTISLASSAVIINGKTQTLTPATNLPANPPIFTIGGSIITANPSGPYQIGTQTLTPGGPAITVSGTTISLATSATALIINGFTETILPSPALLPTSSLSIELPLILGGTTLIANSAGAYILGTQSLVPGGAAITISGTTLSLAPSDAAIMVDGQIYTANYEPLLSTASPAAATVNGEIVSVNSAGAFEIGSQTVTPGGPAITVDGTPVSLETIGTGVDLIVGGSTEALTLWKPTSTLGLGEVIFSALGALPTASITDNPLIDTSGAIVCWEINLRVSLVMGTVAVLFLSPLW